MTGLEVAAGLAAGYVWRKMRRVAGRVDGEVDATLDAGVDRLHEVVVAKLGADTALVRLAEEARSGVEESSRTLERVRLAIEDAAESDRDFGAVLTRLVADLQAMGGKTVVAGDGGAAVGGNVAISSDHGSMAGGVVNIGGPVTLGNPPVPGPVQD